SEPSATKQKKETPKASEGGGGAGKKAVGLPEVDNELVAKCLSEGIQTESKLILSVFDYGGQSVFNVIHHFFLTRYGVYLLVFNMEWLEGGDAVQQLACLDYLRFWLNSVVIHTLNNKGETAPVAFVGTRKDIVSDPKQHGRISALLYDTFSSSVAWPYVLENEHGVGSNGRTTLCFYAVDNTLGRGDPTTKQLLTDVERVISEAAYVKEEKPLVWLQVLDRLAAEKKSFLTLAEVEQAAAVCGMGKEELPALLRFLHGMGALMWHEDEALRDVVILDAVTYFVQPATLVICKHAPTATDPTLHLLPEHKSCRKALPGDFRNMTEKGIVTGQLLQMLLGGEAGRIVTLMVKFGLLVPMQGEEEGADGAGAGGTGDLDPAQEYLVPALLPCCSSTGPWTSAPYSTCYVVLTASSSLHKITPLTHKDLHSEGFLPRGLVERLIGKAVMWCQETAAEANSHNLELFQDVVVLTFGSQRFRLKGCPEQNAIRIDVEGQSPLAVHERILGMVARIISECMKSLHFFTVLPFDPTSAGAGAGAGGGETLYVPLKQMRDMVSKQSGLNIHHRMLKPADVTALFGKWIPDYSLRSRYDVFISYRWGGDSDFAQALFDSFGNYVVGADSRAVQVFLDKKRLQGGRQFQSDFASALQNSLVVAPLLSADAMQRMLDHDPTREDNVVVEWLLALECYACPQSRVACVFPIAFGTRAAHSPMGGNLFAEGLIDKLPDTVPTASAALVRQLMQQAGLECSAELEGRTVRGVATQLSKFLLFPAWTAKKVVVEASKGVIGLLRGCEGVEEEAQERERERERATKCTSPTIPTSPAAAPAPASQMRPLASLTAEEVQQLMSREGLKMLLQPFKQNEITGAVLSYCEEVADLMGPDVGVVGKPTARALLAKILEWNASGVPF
ncbi:hypothetical protein B484DRAFT_395990, partial [Ochromonadaceae sp. CCMP2298]